MKASDTLILTPRKLENTYFGVLEGGPQGGPAAQSLRYVDSDIQNARKRLFWRSGELWVALDTPRKEPRKAQKHI